MKEYAFFFDSSACSGCKACQVACKDKHRLPLGVLWRRVYEVEGGGWERRGGAWVQDVYAYYLSMACNHCARPVCAEVCPSRAITKREDGVVLLDTERCLGCRYCEWACPYGAPQYDARAGHMTKCTFCADELDASRPPACVAACPLRALDFGERRELEARHRSLPAVYPLPERDPMAPALLMTAHEGARRAAEAAGAARVGRGRQAAAPGPTAAPRVGNREEVRPGAGERNREEVRPGAGEGNRQGGRAGSGKGPGAGPGPVPCQELRAP